MIVAVALSVFFWPVPLLVLGLFLVAASFLKRDWSTRARWIVRIAGLGLAVGTAVLLADFSFGTVALTLS